MDPLYFLRGFVIAFFGENGVVNLVEVPSPLPIDVFLLDFLARALPYSSSSASGV